MSIKRYLDWRGYFEGLYLSWVKTVSGTFLALLGTNAVEQMGVAKLGLSWGQAGAVLLSVTVIEVLKYVQSKPKPETIVEDVDTTITKKVGAWIAIGFLSFSLTGCATKSLAKALAGLKDDHATVRARAIGPWGTYEVLRSNPTTNHTVKSDGEVLEIGPAKK